MNLRTVITLVFACWPLVAFSLLPKNPGLIGLLEHSSTYQTPESSSFEPALAVHLEPNLESPRIGELSDISSAETYEWSYEQAGLAVSGYVHDGTTTWYRIHVTKSDQFGWIRQGPNLIFHALSELVTHSLSYMTGTWDKVIYAVPGSPETASKIAVDGHEIPIEVASTAIVGGKLWVLIAVLAEGQCTSTDTPPVLGAGWVPAMAEDAGLNIWFHSRGC